MHPALAEQLAEPTTITFTVLGVPQPAGSKRAFLNPKTKRPIITDDNRKSKPWQSEVKAAAREAYDGELLRGRIGVAFHFYRPRPKGHYRTGRNAHLLRDSAAKRPTTKPDVLKLARAVEDALSGIVWKDDSQIVDEHLHKHYGEPARCEIEIWELPE